MAGGCDVGAEVGVEALEEVAGVVVEAEGGDGDGPRVRFDGVVAGGEPEVVGERFGGVEGGDSGQGGFSAEMLVSG